MRIEFEGTVEEFQLLFIHQFSGRSPGEPRVETLTGLLDRHLPDVPPATPATAPNAAPATVPNAEGLTAGLPLQTEFPQVKIGQADIEEMPRPENPPPFEGPLGTISDEVREGAWSEFKTFCTEWIVNLGAQVEETDENGDVVLDDEGNPVMVAAPQPDRFGLVQALGSSRFTYGVLVMAYEIESLQRLVEKALAEADVLPAFVAEQELLDWIEQVAGSMVQIASVGFHDLVGTYDHSTRWRRRAS